MGIPRVYRKSGEKAIATYDYFDIAEGTGIKKFWFGTNATSSGIKYYITPREDYSSQIETKWQKKWTAEEPSFEKIIDLDFDLSPFNLRKVIKGVAVIQMTLKVRVVDAGSTGDTYLIIKIKKNTTDIVSIQSETIQQVAVGDEYKILNVPVTIPKTHFKKGDILRITIEGWSKENVANFVFSYIGHDPKNRDGENTNGIKPASDDPVTITKSSITIPFVIDL